MAPTLSQADRKRIIALRQTGYRVSDIVRETGITRRTIYFWLRRWQEEGNIEAHRRINYERKTTIEQDLEIFNAHAADPSLSTKVTSSVYRISTDTVRRRLKERGKKFKSPAKKVNTTKQHIEATISTDKVRKRLKAGEKILNSPAKKVTTSKQLTKATISTDILKGRLKEGENKLKGPAKKVTRTKQHTEQAISTDILRTILKEGKKIIKSRAKKVTTTIQRTEPTVSFCPKYNNLTEKTISFFGTRNYSGGRNMTKG